MSIDYSEARDSCLGFAIKKAYINVTLGMFRDVPPSHDPTAGGLYNAICGDEKVYVLRSFESCGRASSDLYCLTVRWRETIYCLDVHISLERGFEVPPVPERIRISPGWHKTGPSALKKFDRRPDLMAEAYEKKMEDNYGLSPPGLAGALPADSV
jgi:hypothetical protein